MSRYLTTVTRKGQITIPAEVRRALSIEEGDKVSIEVEGGTIRLERYGSVVERTAGALRAYAESPPLTAEELRVAAEEAIAEATWERMGR